MPSSRHAAVAGRRAPPGRALRGLLQPGAPAQRDWLCEAAREAARTRGCDLRRAGSQTGSGSTAAAALPSGDFTESVAETAGEDRRGGGSRSKLNPPGETEAGSSGKQPCRRITRRARRADEVGSGRVAWLDAPAPHPIPRPHRPIDPHALKIPASKGRNSDYPKTVTLHFPLNQDSDRCAGQDHHVHIRCGQPAHAENLSRFVAARVRLRLGGQDSAGERPHGHVQLRLRQHGPADANHHGVQLPASAHVHRELRLRQELQPHANDRPGERRHLLRLRFAEPRHHADPASGKGNRTASYRPSTTSNFLDFLALLWYLFLTAALLARARSSSPNSTRVRGESRSSSSQLSTKGGTCSILESKSLREIVNAIAAAGYGYCWRVVEQAHSTTLIHVFPSHSKLRFDEIMDVRTKRFEIKGDVNPTHTINQSGFGFSHCGGAGDTLLHSPISPARSSS